MNLGSDGPGWTTWALLVMRPALALAGQITLATLLALWGHTTPWRTAADYWLATFVVAEVANLVLLMRLHRREGPLHFLRFQRKTLPGDLLWLVPVWVVAGPVGTLPNLWLSEWLWGDTQTGADLLFRPLELPIAIGLVVIFPIVHAWTELPTYYGEVMPRLRAGLGRWPAIALSSGVLSVQHAFLPFLWDGRYLIWRSLMFAGFALWLGFVLDRRPTLLPYLVVSHAILDLSLPLSVLFLSLH